MQALRQTTRARVASAAPLTTSRLASRRLASTAPPAVRRAANGNPYAKPAAALLGLTAVVVGLYSIGDRSKRNAAIKALDTHHIAAATPDAVFKKTEEVKQSIVDPSSSSSSSSSDESDVGQQAAYDPVTGDINWDCPCLGGMAHGPCGEQFKTAFTCFVMSEDEIKGSDCIDAFRAMQDCFREHPEHYADQLNDDPEDDDDDFELVSTPSESGSLVNRAEEAASSLSSSVSSAVSSVGSVLSGSSSDLSTDDSAAPAMHRSRSATPAPQHKGSAFEFDTQRHGGAQPAGAGRIGPQYTGTTPNHSGGEPDLLGRNAASGSKPSGESATARDKHLEAVQKTRSGEHAVGDAVAFPRG